MTDLVPLSKLPTTLPFRQSFENAPQPVVSGALVAFAHGFATPPTLVTYKIRFLVATAGYAVGDEVLVPANTSTAGLSRNQPPLIDGTNVSIRYTATATVFSIQNKTTGSNADIPNANIEFIVTAHA